MGDNYIILPNEYIQYNSIDVSLLCSILMLNNSNSVSILNVKYILDLFNIKSSNTHSKKLIYNSIQSLIDNNSIEIYSDYNMYNIISEISIIKANDILYIKLLNENTNTFTKVYYNDIYKILDYYKNNSKLNVYSLLKTYIIIMSHMNIHEDNELYKLSNPSIETIAKETNVTIKSIETYIKILKDLEIINYNHAGRVNSEKYINTSNIYCRWCNTEYLEKYINKDMDNIIKESNNDKLIINQNKSLGKKINKLKSKCFLSLEENTELENLINTRNNLNNKKF